MSERLGCSTISFRRLGLAEALSQIATLGFTEVDLGAIPSVCDHVPVPLEPAHAEAILDVVRQCGLGVRTVNADTGAMNDPDGEVADLAPLVSLAREVGAEALVLPAGAADRQPKNTLRDDLARLAAALEKAHRQCAEAGVDLLVEAPHHDRLVHDLARTAALVEALDGTDVGMVLDVSHVVAGGEEPLDAIPVMGTRLRHVHLRDAVPGNINLSLGRGDVDFAGVLAALDRQGYAGHLSLELETHDLADDDRPAETARAGRLVTALLTDPNDNAQLEDA